MHTDRQTCIFVVLAMFCTDTKARETRNANIITKCDKKKGKPKCVCVCVRQREREKGRET